MTEITDREIEVILAIARHGSDRQAGKALGITVQTVKNAGVSARRKLGVKTTAQAFAALTSMRGFRVEKTSITTVTVRVVEER